MVKKFPALLTAALSLAMVGAMAKEKPATAVLKDAGGAKVGTATFRETGGGVLVSVKLEGVKPGVHGIHIHAAGSCVAPAFLSAAGHFNPAHKQHGSMNPQGMHRGDLPNITVAANGRGSLRATVTGIDLGTGENGLFHPGGTALVVHANPDDLKSDPAGNAGARVACGVIGR